MSETESSSPDTQPRREPWLTVHALTEFVFCPRAGLLAAETNSFDEQEQPQGNLDFSLPYTLDELEYRLARNLNRLWLQGGVSLFILLVGIVSAWQDRMLMGLFAGMLLLLLAKPVSRRVQSVLTLVEQRRAVLERERFSPPVQEATRQNVNWWDFLNAGWMSIVSHESHRDEELALSGSPWRVLRQGSFTIPVFKLAHYNSSQGSRIFPQHIVRMAAYCHLIETCEGATSPCGIVLYGDTYEGTTIPNDAEARNSFLAALQSAQQWLALSADDRKEPSPAEPALCSGCHLGRPVVYLEGVSEHSRHGLPIPVYGTVAKDGRLYHCACGDRFIWRPPQEDAIRLGLV